MGYHIFLAMVLRARAPSELRYYTLTLLKTTAKTVYDQACSKSDQGIDRDQSKYNNDINNCLNKVETLRSYNISAIIGAKVMNAFRHGCCFVSRISPFSEMRKGLVFRI